MSKDEFGKLRIPMPSIPKFEVRSPFKVQVPSLPRLPIGFKLPSLPFPVYATCAVNITNEQGEEIKRQAAAKLKQQRSEPIDWEEGAREIESVLELFK